MVRIVNPNLLPEVNYAVTVALRGGTEVHYVTIHNDMMLEIAEDQQEENDDFGGWYAVEPCAQEFHRACGLHNQREKN